MNQKQRDKSLAIAQDVLEQIKFMNVDTGAYLETDITLSAETAGKSLQKHMDKLLTKSKPCTVCALGACFLSHVNLFNQFKVPDNLTDKRYPHIDGWSGDCDEMFFMLRKSLGRKNMILIESAFEERDCTDHHTEDLVDPAEMVDDEWLRFYGPIDKLVKAEEVAAAVAFGYKYDDSTNRLKAIMRNVIANGGEFMPKITKAIATEVAAERQSHLEYLAELKREREEDKALQHA